MYGGHGPIGVSPTIIDDGIAMCDRILAGTDEAVEIVSVEGSLAWLASARGTNYLPVCGGLCNIMYSKETAYRRPHPVIQGKPNLYR